jgi:hypothetical protein
MQLVPLRIGLLKADGTIPSRSPPPGAAWMKPPIPKFKVRKMPPVPSFPTGANVAGWPYLESDDRGVNHSPKGKTPRGGSKAVALVAPGAAAAREATAKDARAARAAATLEAALAFESADMLEKYRILERLLEEQKQEAAGREARAIKLAIKERELLRVGQERAAASRVRNEEEALRASRLRETARRRQTARQTEEARLLSAEDERIAVQLETRERFAVIDTGDPAPNGGAVQVEYS